MDLSASNERLETENRKLKVAAIGMMAQLRELGHPADASELNISGLGLWTGGDDAGTEDKGCLLYTSPSPRDYAASRMPSSA